MEFRKSKVYKAITFALVFSFLTSNVSQGASLNLPDHSQFIPLSAAYSLPVLKGLKFDPDNPLKMEFIIDTADKKDISQEEASLLIKYFLAGLATPEEDIWVNLSPYEQDRIIPENLGQTDLGKDLLSQDYLLKQLMASLTYPESGTGKDFWETTYGEVLKIAKTTNLPVNTFNKVWIVPDMAEVFESGNSGFITKASLKACLEEDYLSLKNKVEDIKREKKALDDSLIEKINQVSSQAMRQTILPKITEDINKGENFARLRQIYHSLILGMWFKGKFKDSLYRHYIDQQKIKGIDLEDKTIRDTIYQQYVQAFKDGIYNYIRTDTEPKTHKKIKRRYYSGGFSWDKADGSSPLKVTNGSFGKMPHIPGDKMAEIHFTPPENPAQKSTANSPIVSGEGSGLDIQQEKKHYADYSNKMSITDIDPKQLSGKRVFVRADLNVVGGGKIKDETRIREIVEDIEYLVEAGAIVVIASHNGRRKDFYEGREESDGTIDKNYSLEPVAKKLTEILREEGVIGPDKEVRFAQDSIGDEVKKLIDKLSSGDILLLENLRFYKGEEGGSQEYAKQLYETIAPEVYVNIAFGALHRGEQASFNPLMSLMPNSPKVVGRLVAKEIQMLESVCFKNPTHPIYAVFGGSKVADKVEVLRRFIREGIADKIRITGAMAFPFLIGNGYSVLEYSFSMIERDHAKRREAVSYANEILTLAEERGIKILLPEVFRTVKDIKDVKNITPETPIDEHTLINFPPGNYWVLDEVFDSDKIREELKGVKNIILNGTAGLYEIERFAQGTDMLVRIILESPAFKLVLGGDGAAAVNKVMGKSLFPIDRDKVYLSTGGGAALKLLAGERLSALDLIDEKAHTASSAITYSLEPRAGYDSRGKQTVEVVLRSNGLEVTGDVPAGASKGEDEARTVTVEQAIKNIKEIILPLLQESGFDLRKHKDLIAMEKLLIDRAGENFKDLGANAVVPVSRALWKMAAKLEGVELWEYIRKYEPQAVADNSNIVYPLMNIFNGGLHALKDGERLGKDRIAIQEIMIVPVGAKSQEEALEMGDKIDYQLKWILLYEYFENQITRADEAGFSVKGLGDSNEAIEYVFQAIQKAGYEPGKDVKLSLDVAATSFFNKETSKYSFQGKEQSSEEMIAYYESLAKRYQDKIFSIEDGLAENDWEGWQKLTEKMKKYGIRTVGDDLFVTQLGRLKNGIEKQAATDILIKVNQNGTMFGTLEVIKRAKQAGMGWIVSHRSGETLDTSIADLAYATKALGLKTGDPQPDYDFGEGAQYHNQPLVRRVKYLRMIEIERFNRFDIQLKGNNEGVLDEIDRYYSGIPENDSRRQILYEWLQRHPSKLAAKAIARLGIDWQAVVPKLLAIAKGDPYGNPRAAARQLQEILENGTAGGVKVSSDVIEQTKEVVWRENTVLGELIKPPEALLFPKSTEGNKPGYLLLVRHGETEWSEAVFNKWAGWFNSLITNKGKEEAKKAGEKMKGLSFDAAFSSDLSRAINTLDEFLTGIGQTDISREEAPALREKSYGLVGGWAREDVEKTFGNKVYRSWRRELNGRAPGGEALSDVIERVKPYFIRGILPQIIQGKNVVISAHGNSLRALLVVLREHTEGRELSEKEIASLEVPLSTPIGITFSENLKHNEFWSNQIAPDEVIKSLRASSSLVAHPAVTSNSDRQGNPGGIDLEDTAQMIKVKSDENYSPQMERPSFERTIPFDFPNWQGLSFKIVKIEDIKDLKEDFL